ncbi:mucin-17-like [Xenia sp. Carnegie-2017]|uniref:mucin-17-like n=1 Tax=Xenia sp. Carnegie-2017 TaxID=2897299 RepID=UPI001F0494AB|nr:mucin-17-like [Xenia sp. Carnegie-2017]
MSENSARKNSDVSKSKNLNFGPKKTSATEKLKLRAFDELKEKLEKVIDCNSITVAECAQLLQKITVPNLSKIFSNQLASADKKCSESLVDGLVAKNMQDIKSNNGVTLESQLTPSDHTILTHDKDHLQTKKSIEEAINNDKTFAKQFALVSRSGNTTSAQLDGDNGGNSLQLVVNTSSSLPDNLQVSSCAPPLLSPGLLTQSFGMPVSSQANSVISGKDLLLSNVLSINTLQSSSKQNHASLLTNPLVSVYFPNCILPSKQTSPKLSQCVPQPSNTIAAPIPSQGVPRLSTGSTGQIPLQGVPQLSTGNTGQIPLQGVPQLSTGTTGQIPLQGVPQLSTGTTGQIPLQGVPQLSTGTTGQIPSQDVSQLSTGTTGQIPLQGVPQLSTGTTGQIPLQGVPQLSTGTTGQIPLQGVPQLSTGTTGQIPLQGVPQLSTGTTGQIPLQGVPQLSTGTTGQIPLQGVPQLSTGTTGQIPLQGVPQLSTGTTGQIPLQGVPQLSTGTTGQIPLQGVPQLSTGTTGQIPLQGVPQLSTGTTGQIPLQGVPQLSTGTTGQIPLQGVPQLSTGTTGQIPLQGVHQLSTGTTGQIPLQGLLQLSTSINGPLLSQYAPQPSTNTTAPIPSQCVPRHSIGTAISVLPKGVALPPSTAFIASTLSQGIPQTVTAITAQRLSQDVAHRQSIVTTAPILLQGVSGPANSTISSIPSQGQLSTATSAPTLSHGVFTQPSITTTSPTLSHGVLPQSSTNITTSLKGNIPIGPVLKVNDPSVKMKQFAIQISTPPSTNVIDSKQLLHSNSSSQSTVVMKTSQNQSTYLSNVSQARKLRPILPREPLAKPTLRLFSQPRVNVATNQNVVNNNIKHQLDSGRTKNIKELPSIQPTAVTLPDIASSFNQQLLGGSSTENTTMAQMPSNIEMTMKEQAIKALLSIGNEQQVVRLRQEENEPRSKTSELNKSDDSLVVFDTDKGIFKVDNVTIDPQVNTIGKESYTCGKCGKIFTSLSYLARHIKRVCPDMTQRKWKCNHCEKAFRHPFGLQQHVFTHTGERPHKCTQCPKAFYSSNDLRRHSRIHSGERPYKCKHCDKTFATTISLKTHTFIHTGEKPHRCPRCPKTFATSSKLSRHVVTHSEQRPFPCDQCPKTFNRSGDLRRHVQNIHAGKLPTTDGQK